MTGVGSGVGVVGVEVPVSEPVEEDPDDVDPETGGLDELEPLDDDPDEDVPDDPLEPDPDDPVAMPLQTPEAAPV